MKIEEKIARLIYKSYCQPYCLLPEWEWAQREIKDRYLSLAFQILVLIKEEYVKLADDQSLPKSSFSEETLDIRERIAHIDSVISQPKENTVDYMLSEIGTPKANEILAQWAEANGYVKLADDQSLPLPSNNIKGEAREGYYLGQQSLTNTNWRKVEIKNGKR